MFFFNNRQLDKQLILKRFENSQPPTPMSQFTLKDISNQNISPEKLDKIIKMSQIGYGSLMEKTLLVTSELCGLGKTYFIKHKCKE